MNLATKSTTMSVVLSKTCCRLCLDDGSVHNLLDVFSVAGLCEKIAEVYDISVATNDNLPSMLCMICFQEILDFRKQHKSYEEERQRVLANQATLGRRKDQTRKAGSSALTENAVAETSLPANKTKYNKSKTASSSKTSKDSAHQTSGKSNKNSEPKGQVGLGIKLNTQTLTKKNPSKEKNNENNATTTVAPGQQNTVPVSPSQHAMGSKKRVRFSIHEDKEGSSPPPQKKAKYSKSTEKKSSPSTKQVQQKNSVVIIPPSRDTQRPRVEKQAETVTISNEITIDPVTGSSCNKVRQLESDSTTSDSTIMSNHTLAGSRKIVVIFESPIKNTEKDKPPNQVNNGSSSSTKCCSSAPKTTERENQEMNSTSKNANNVDQQNNNIACATIIADRGIIIAAHKKDPRKETNTSNLTSSDHTRSEDVGNVSLMQGSNPLVALASNSSCQQNSPVNDIAIDSIDCRPLGKTSSSTGSKKTCSSIPKVVSSTTVEVASLSRSDPTADVTHQHKERTTDKNSAAVCTTDTANIGTTVPHQQREVIAGGRVSLTEASEVQMETNNSSCTATNENPTISNSSASSTANIGELARAHVAVSSATSAHVATTSALPRSSAEDAGTTVQSLPDNASTQVPKGISKRRYSALIRVSSNLFDKPASQFASLRDNLLIRNMESSSSPLQVSSFLINDSVGTTANSVLADNSSVAITSSLNQSPPIPNTFGNQPSANPPVASTSRLHASTSGTAPTVTVSSQLSTLLANPMPSRNPTVRPNAIPIPRVAFNNPRFPRPLNVAASNNIVPQRYEAVEQRGQCTARVGTSQHVQRQSFTVQSAPPVRTILTPVIISSNAASGPGNPIGQSAVGGSQMLMNSTVPNVAYQASNINTLSQSRPVFMCQLCGEFLLTESLVKNHLIQVHFLDSSQTMYSTVYDDSIWSLLFYRSRRKSIATPEDFNRAER